MVNSADDERNPVATGLLDAAMKKVGNGKVFMIPASPTTGGHGTTGGMAKLYAEEVRKLIETAPRLAKSRALPSNGGRRGSLASCRGEIGLGPFLQQRQNRIPNGIPHIAQRGHRERQTLQDSALGQLNRREHDTGRPEL